MSVAGMSGWQCYTEQLFFEHRRDMHGYRCGRADAGFSQGLEYKER